MSDRGAGLDVTTRPNHTISTTTTMTSHPSDTRPEEDDPMTSIALPADITPTVGTIHPSELRQLRADDPNTLILDVRTTSEFESVHIPGSYNVPLDQLGEHLHAVAELEHPVVLVCLSGNRASTAHKQLTEAGKSHLRVLEGGIGAWQTAGGDVVRGQPKWTLERQVRGVAGMLVLASLLAGLKSPKARLLAGGVGLGLAVSALTDTCTMGTLLAKLPYNRGPRCVVDDVLAQMRWTPPSA